MAKNENLSEEDLQKIAAAVSAAREPKPGLWKTSGVILIITVLAVSIICILAGAFRKASAEVQVEYQTVKARKTEEVYQKFYQPSYEAAEKKYHVHNEISIELLPVQERNRLEVLEVSSAEIVTLDASENSDRISSWLEVPGKGVFTVNLQAAEFIADDLRQFVQVRVPAPDLTEFTIDYRNVTQLLFQNDIFNESYAQGEDWARAQLKEASLRIEQDIQSNQQFYDSAKDAARKMIAGLLHKLNPSLPELTVEVEFTD